MIHRYVARDKRKVFSQETLAAVIQHHIVTEKSTIVREHNTYCFAVARWAGKIAIKKAVESLFSVKVCSVNTLVTKGKRKMFRQREGVRSTVKKAMVRLETGNKIELEGGISL